ncbi:hypothetical protein CF142_14135 [Aeromonas caviae]|uniref:hypothetical protein n=2 Tax=Aeromonadaceae TaxID=84642 RepID=UPI0005B4255F|nr:hypothetical protein [Aeromonas caviae]TNH69844.1 hypothetical protein CF142_14135 [Aeromonas caviae]
MALTRYQRRMVNYVKANKPCYAKRRHKGMSKAELRELEEQADGVAIAWLDQTVPRWREGQPPKTNKVIVTASADEDEDDEH